LGAARQPTPRNDVTAVALPSAALTSVNGRNHCGGDDRATIKKPYWTGRAIVTAWPELYKSLCRSRSRVASQHRHRVSLLYSDKKCRWPRNRL